MGCRERGGGGHWLFAAPPCRRVPLKKASVGWGQSSWAFAPGLLRPPGKLRQTARAPPAPKGHGGPAAPQNKSSERNTNQPARQPTSQSTANAAAPTKLDSIPNFGGTSPLVEQATKARTANVLESAVDDCEGVRIGAGVRAWVHRASSRARRAARGPLAG